MAHQPSFASLDFAAKKKRTKPTCCSPKWRSWCRGATSNTDRAPLSQARPPGGRQPSTLSTMLPSHCLQKWSNLPDPGAEEAGTSAERGCAHSLTWTSVDRARRASNQTQSQHPDFALAKDIEELAQGAAGHRRIDFAVLDRIFVDFPRIDRGKKMPNTTYQRYHLRGAEPLACTGRRRPNSEDRGCRRSGTL